MRAVRRCFAKEDFASNIQASLFIARRIIFPRQATAAGKSFSMAVLCIALSLVPLISVLSVSSGLIYGMTDRIIGLSSSHIKVFFSSGSPDALSASSLDAAAKRIAAVDGITAAFAESDAAALACGENRREGVMIRAINPDIFAQSNSFSTLLKADDGSLDSFVSCARQRSFAATDVVPACAGKKTCQMLSLKAGDTFRLVTSSRKAGKVIPRTFTARLMASVTSGYEELDAAWVFIPLEDAYRKIGSSLMSFVLAETKDAFSPALYETQRAVEAAAGSKAAVFRWDEMNTSEFENFASTQAMLICIMSLIVLVASLNISSSLVMLAEERRQEIAILKCMGSSQRVIETAYILSGGAAGLLGSLLGVPIGLLCAVNMNAIIKAMEIAVNAVLSPASPIRLMDSAYYLSSIPLNLPLKSIVLIVFVTLALSLLVSVFPARKAGRL